MQTPHADEHLETLVAHLLAYRFLGKAFFEAPTLELLTLLKHEALFADWPLDSAVPALQTGLNTLRQYCEQWTEADLPALKRDFARLFVGPNHLLAPPWESVYRSEERLLFEKETLQVRAMYRQYGFAVPADDLQPDDHFGLEMLFVAHLCQLSLNALNNAQPEAIDRSQDGLAAFFSQHVCQWADAFLKDVETNAETPYYQGLAMLAAGSIAHTVAHWQIALENTNASCP